MKSVFDNKCIQAALAILAMVSVIILIINSFFSGVGGDSAVLLVDMERIAEGYIPYKNFHIDYPPLWFYINVWLKWLFRVPYGCFHFYLAIHWSFVLGSAASLYYISRKWGANKYYAFFVSWLFILIIYWPDGSGILFEIPSLFWGLLAVCLYLKLENKSFLWQLLVGACACCAFLTKQFGAGFFLLILWLIISSYSTQKWIKVAMYIIGYAVPLLICYVCWGKDVFQAILFNGYGTDSMDVFWGIETNLLVKFQRMCGNLAFFSYRIAPFFIVAVILCPLLFIKGKWRETLFCLFGVGGFLLQFYYVYNGYHYFLYMIPFVLLFIPIYLSIKSNMYVRYLVLIGIAVMVMESGFSAYRMVWRQYVWYSQTGVMPYRQQKLIGQQIASNIQRGETIFIPNIALCRIYYTGNLYPSCMSEIGYGVGPMVLNVNAAAKWIEKADYVLHYTDEKIKKIYPNGPMFEYYYSDSLQQYVNQFPSDTLFGELVLHKLKKCP